MIVQSKVELWMIAVYVVSTAPTSTTNMTGLWIWTRGSSLRNASGVDFHSIFGSSSPPLTRRGLGRLRPRAVRRYAPGRGPGC